MVSSRLKYLNKVHNSTLDEKSGPVETTAHILNFLSDDEILQYRLTSRSAYETAKKILGPYDNKTQFILGTSQYFSSQKEMERAWQVYKKAVNPKKKISLKPALLYKSNDQLSTKFIKNQFPEGESVLENGRIYQCIPLTLYTWQNNAAWLLSNIHLGRPFLATSPLTSQFIFRQDNPSEYSAWAKEIAAITKAGYRITNINSSGYITFNASCALDNDYKKCQIKKLNLDNKEVKAILKMVLTHIYQTPWGFFSNIKPNMEDFQKYTLVLSCSAEKLTVYWLNNGTIVSKSYLNSNVQDILKMLPEINHSFNNKKLIELIATKYNFTLTHKDKQSFIEEQLTPSSSCLIM